MVQLVKGELLVYQSFKFHHAVNEYQLRLGVRFLWPVYYIVIYILYYVGPLSCILGCN